MQQNPGFSKPANVDVFPVVASLGWRETMTGNTFAFVGELRTQPVPGSEIVGPAELRKREDENKTEGNWGEQALSLFLFLFFASPTFRVPFTFASSPLPESLEQARANNATLHAIFQASQLFEPICSSQRCLKNQHLTTHVNQRGAYGKLVD